MFIGSRLPVMGGLGFFCILCLRLSPLSLLLRGGTGMAVQRPSTKRTLSWGRSRSGALSALFVIAYSSFSTYSLQYSYSCIHFPLSSEIWFYIITQIQQSITIYFHVGSFICFYNYISTYLYIDSLLFRLVQISNI